MGLHKLDSSFDNGPASLPGPLARFMTEAGRSLGRFSQHWRGNRPALTLLHISADQTHRADADAQGRLLAEPSRLDLECHALTDLPSVVSQALRRGSRPGLRLWVLHDGLPVYQLGVPLAQIKGLDQDQIGQALMHELDETAGVAMASQQFAYAFSGEGEGKQWYSLTHAPRELVGLLRKAAGGFGCELMGLLYPGALPLPLEPKATGQTWARLEIWPNALFAIQREASGRIGRKIIAADAKPQRIHAEVERWRNGLSETLHWEKLGLGAALDLLPPGAVWFALERDDTLYRWLSAWAGVLAASQTNEFPVLQPGLDPRREWWIMAGYATAALLVCLAQFGWQTQRKNAYQEELSFLQRIEIQIKSLNINVKKYQTTLDEMKKQTNALHGRDVPAAAVLGALRVRQSALLRGLAANAGDGLVVEEIRVKPDGITVKGVSLSISDPNEMTFALESHLQGLGWKVSLPKKKDLGLMAEGGPWAFDIDVSDTGLAGFVSE